MICTNKDTLRVLVSLLRFPDEHFRNDLERLAAKTHEEHDDWPLPLKDNLDRFVHEARHCRLFTLQETHGRVFSTHPRTCLYLSWHHDDDNSPDLGRALAELAQLYADTSFECNTQKLAHAVPISLEYIMDGQGWGRMIIIDGFGGLMRQIAARLADSGTLYAPLGRAVALIIGEEEPCRRHAGPVDELW